MIGIWVLGGLAVITLASTIWPGWIGAFLPSQSRIAGAPPRWVPRWPVRAVSVAVLAGLVTALVTQLWPDDATRDLAGAGTLLVASIALAIWFLAAIVDRRDREQRKFDEEEAELLDGSAGDGGIRVHRRPRTPGYVFEYWSVFLAAVTVLISGVLVGVNLDPDRRDAQQAAATPTPTVDPGDETLRRFNTLHPPYEVITAAPETGSVVDPWTYAIVDAEAELPYVVWHQSAAPIGMGAAGALADADLVLQHGAFQCSPTAIVVIETETTVTVGVAVTRERPVPTATPAASADPTTMPTPEPSPTVASWDTLCLNMAYLNTSWFPVALSAPLGDREVLGYNGGRVREYFPPIDYGDVLDD